MSYPTGVGRIGRQVRALRLSRRMSQSELGRRSGLDQSQISRLESGEYDAIGKMVWVAISLGAEWKLEEK